jgi:hypothetical protein
MGNLIFFFFVLDNGLDIKLGLCPQVSFLIASRAYKPPCAAGASRSRGTSTPRAVRALQSPPQAALAEGRASLQLRVPPLACRERTGRTRHVQSKLHSRPS